MTVPKKIKKPSKNEEVKRVMVDDPLNQILEVLLPSEAIKEEPLPAKKKKSKK